MPIPGHMVDSSVNHPSLATFIPARAVPGAPVGSTVAIGTLMTGHLEGEELVAVDWNGGGGGGDGRSGGDKDDDDDDSLGANRTDERSSSCFFGSSLRAVVVVPRSRTQAESERTQKEASGEEVKKGEWKRERERESSCWSSFFFFFCRARSIEIHFFFLQKISSGLLAKLSSLYLSMASIDLPELPDHLVLRRLQKSDFEKGLFEERKGGERIRFSFFFSFRCLSIDRATGAINFLSTLTLSTFLSSFSLQNKKTLPPTRQASSPSSRS